MGKYSRLLVAVDGSDASFHALREAFKLSSGWVTVLSVTPLYEGDLRLMGVPDLERVLREPCDTALARAQELADAAGVMIQPLCERGEPHERIVARAAAGDRDLIIMGAKGHSFLERVLVGSVTQRVIGFSKTDVLVVPMAGELAWEKILLATDGSEYSAAAAARAVDLAQAYGSELKVLSVIDIPGLMEGQAAGTLPALFAAHQGYVTEVTGQAARLEVKAEGLVREGRAFPAITALAREEKAGLIVMGSHGRTGLTRLLMGSTTEKVIGHASCPVLVVTG
jgi:nucleotide-binding universal stress UspA family protein